MAMTMVTRSLLINLSERWRRERRDAYMEKEREDGETAALVELALARSTPEKTALVVSLDLRRRSSIRPLSELSLAIGAPRRHLERPVARSVPSSLSHAPTLPTKLLLREMRVAVMHRRALGWIWPPRCRSFRRCRCLFHHSARPPAAVEGDESAPRSPSQA
ncbi:hypothetical protein OsJ_24492 [Oryza sativa Japonica Group]|uniref:Uncharacterized protein n=1 Tax=Oryza sativa subsp. japonica TaxID=39947 RepID=B9FXK6_ORYSJ|nr:hypothetical protein OsJ_24492 [Oryza sativa Japonica Group]